MDEKNKNNENAEVPAEKPVNEPMDGPAFEEQPADNISMDDGHSHEVKKDKKWLKYVLILLIVLVLAGVGYFVYAMSDLDSDNNDSAASDTAEEVSAFAPEYVAFDGGAVHYLNESGEATQALSVEGESVVAADNNGTKTVVYSLEYDVATGVASKMLARDLAGETVKEYDFSGLGVRYYSIEEGAFNFDAGKLVYEISDESGMMAKLAVLDLASGESADVFTPGSDEDGLVFVIGWSDENTVVLQKQSCRQCDGPPLPELLSLDVSTGDVSDLYKATGADIMSDSPSAIAEFSADGSKIMMLRAPAGLGEAAVKNDGMYAIFEIDPKTGDSKKNYEGTWGYMSVLGYSEDGASAYVDTTTYEKAESTEDSDINIGGESYSSTKALKLINLTNGSVSDFDVTIAGFDDNSRYIGMVVGEDYVAFGIVGDSSDGQKFSVSAYHLPTTGGENTATTVFANVESETGVLEVLRVR